MDYNEFVGHVQHRARASSAEEAIGSIRATLSVLAQRLAGQEPDNLAAQLPPEIGRYLRQQQAKSERFGLQAFFERVADQEDADLPDAVHHARAVVSVLRDAVSQGELDNVRAQLPEEYDPLFESGSEGQLA